MTQRRPLYQRLLLPVLGLVLIALGIIGIILPFVPGLPAFLLGLICCSCVHHPSEVWMRGKVSAIKDRIFPTKKSVQETKRDDELPPPGAEKS